MYVMLAAAAYDAVLEEKHQWLVGVTSVSIVSVCAGCMRACVCVW